MPKKADRPPSPHSLRNDRGNHLGNAQNHLHLVSKTAKKFEDSGVEEITEQDIFKLLEFADKCANTLMKYINARKFMGKDELIAVISSGLEANLQDENFDQEIQWLKNNFGELCVEKCREFIQSETEIQIQSVDALYGRIREFRENFKRVYSSANIKERFREYLDEILKVAIGVALFCEDGLKYYKPSGFSVRSIRLGSKMFLDGVNNLLQLGTAGEM